MRLPMVLALMLSLSRCTTPIKTSPEFRAAVVGNKIRAVRRAVREGYPLEREISHCFPPLPFAAAMDRSEIALVIIDQRPTPELINQANCMGLTSLHFARLNQNEDFARALIRRGADQTLRDGEGHTAADYARSPKLP